MTSHVHAFDPREGGSFRISPTYDAPTGTGKTTAHTDTELAHMRISTHAIRIADRDLGSFVWSCGGHR